MRKSGRRRQRVVELTYRVPVAIDDNGGMAKVRLGTADSEEVAVPTDAALNDGGEQLENGKAVAARVLCGDGVPVAIGEGKTTTEVLTFFF